MTTPLHSLANPTISRDWVERARTNYAAAVRQLSATNRHNVPGRRELVAHAFRYLNTTRRDLRDAERNARMVRDTASLHADRLFLMAAE